MKHAKSINVLLLLLFFAGLVVSFEDFDLVVLSPFTKNKTSGLLETKSLYNNLTVHNYTVSDEFCLSNGSGMGIPVCIYNWSQNISINITGFTGSFTSLNDTPDAYAGFAGTCVTVNATEDGLNFSNCSSGGSESDPFWNANYSQGIDANWVPYSNNTFLLGNATRVWDAVYAMAITDGSLFLTVIDLMLAYNHALSTGNPHSATFLQLNDTVDAYGAAGECVTVNATGDGLNFSACGGGGATYYAGDYLVLNASNYFAVNETLLNGSIDLRTAANISALWSNASDQSVFRPLNASGWYLYNDSTSIYLNETRLNDTIDARVPASSTYYADEQYINLNATNSFNANITALNATLYAEWQNLTYYSDESYINKNASNSFNLNSTVLNATIDARMNSTTFYAYRTNATGWTNTTEAINLTYWYDHDSYNWTEDAGGGGNAAIDLFFENVTSVDQIVLREYYLGSSSHTIQVQLYDFNDASWESYFTFVGQGGFTILTIPVYDSGDHVNSSGYSILRFNHVQSGVATHRFYLDFAWLVKGSNVGSSTNLDGYAKYSFGYNNFSGVGNMTASNYCFYGSNDCFNASNFTATTETDPVFTANATSGYNAAADWSPNSDTYNLGTWVGGPFAKTRWNDLYLKGNLSNGTDGCTVMEACASTGSGSGDSLWESAAENGTYLKDSASFINITTNLTVGSSTENAVLAGSYLNFTSPENGTARIVFTPDSVVSSRLYIGSEMDTYNAIQLGDAAIGLGSAIKLFGSTHALSNYAEKILFQFGGGGGAHAYFMNQSEFSPFQGSANHNLGNAVYPWYTLYANYHYGGGNRGDDIHLKANDNATGEGNGGYAYLQAQAGYGDDGMGGYSGGDAYVQGGTGADAPAMLCGAGGSTHITGGDGGSDLLGGGVGGNGGHIYLDAGEGGAGMANGQHGSIYTDGNIIPDNDAQDDLGAAAGPKTFNDLFLSGNLDDGAGNSCSVAEACTDSTGDFVPVANSSYVIYPSRSALTTFNASVFNASANVTAPNFFASTVVSVGNTTVNASLDRNYLNLNAANLTYSPTNSKFTINYGKRLYLNATGIAVGNSEIVSPITLPLQTGDAITIYDSVQARPYVFGTQNSIFYLNLTDNSGAVNYSTRVNGTERIKLTSGGILSFSGQSRAHANRATALTIANAAVNKVNFTAEDFDAQNEMNISTGSSGGGRFVAREAGTYLVNAVVLFNQAAGWDAGEYCALVLFKNNVQTYNLGLSSPAAGTVFCSAGGSTTVALSAGDYLEVYVYQDSDASKDLFPSGQWNYFAVTKVA